jgi:phosphoglycolate phosphatase
LGSRRTAITPRAIVFDFDLTLADSRPGFVVSHHFAAAELGLPAPDRLAIAGTIGIPIERAVPALYPGLDEDLLRDYIRLYRNRADQVMVDLTSMLSGAVETVRALDEAGIALAIVSQKLRHLVEGVLQREAILDYFKVVLGGQDVPEYKPDPRGLLLGIERLEVPPGDALYVGDTTIDAETARQAGVPFLGVLTGVTSREEFASYPSEAVLDSVKDLPSILGI